LVPAAGNNFFAGFKKSSNHRQRFSGANADGIITIEIEQLRYT
jgi:hypothetical protein